MSMPGGENNPFTPARPIKEVLEMEFAMQHMTWKEIALELTKEFLR